MKSTLYRPDLVVEKILLLDGLSRAGKFLLGKVVSNFQKVEFFQSAVILEHLPILRYLGVIDTPEAISYFRLNLNMYIYERAIGRNLNTRPSDGSSITNSTEYELYIQRMSRPDGIESVNELIEDQRLPSFLTHECMSQIDFFLEACPDFQMINIQRHPIDLVASWFLRGWGERWGNDPLAFIPVVKNLQNGLPWFVEDWKDEYNKMSPIDRCIKSICTMYNLDQTVYSNFKDKEKYILLICYEDFFSRPDYVIGQIMEFIGRSPFVNMKAVLQREGCPKEISLKKRRENYNIIRSLGNFELVEQLLVLSIEYEKQWGLNSF